MGRPRKDRTPKRRRRGTGSVYTRADGRIGVTLPADLDPRRRPVYSPGGRKAFTSEAEAAAWLDAEIRARANPPPASAHGAELLGAYLQRWHADNVPLWPVRTARAYRRSLALLLPYLGEVPLGKLSHELIRGALARLLEATWQRQRQDGTITRAPAPYSRRTVSMARMVLGLALGDLVPDVMAANPVRRARLPKAQVPEQPVWDGAEAARFLEAADRMAPHLALAYRLILRRGLRRGEVLALRWSDIDERRAILTVGATAGQRAGETGETKGRRRREIPLSRELIDRLNRQRNMTGNITVWVFANPETGKPWHAEILSQYIPAICAAAGLTTIAPKDMRATCATILLDEGWALPRVSRLLGHASVTVTGAFYERAIRRRDEQHGQMAEEMDAALDRGAETARGDTPRPLRQAAE